MGHDLRGKIDSFEGAALPHLNAVYRAAVALCGRAQDAEDLVQTTFLKAFERFASFEQGTNCRAWLLRILRNTWIDQLRRQKLTGLILPIAEDMIAETPRNYETVWSNPQDILQNFSDEQVITALSQLPADLRFTLFLIDVEQLSQAEVAEITDVAVGTVKSRTSRARAGLRERLASYAREMGFVGGER